MQYLVERNKPEVALSHAGVLFLLEDMGVKLPQSGRHRSNSEVKLSKVKKGGHALCQLAPATLATAPTPTSAFRIAPIAPPPRPPHSTQPTLPAKTHRRLPVNMIAESVGSPIFSDSVLLRNVHGLSDHMQPTDRPVDLTGLLTYNPYKDDLLVWKQPTTKQTKKVRENEITVAKGAKSKGARKGVEYRMREVGNGTTFGGQYGGNMLEYLPLAHMQEEEEEEEEGDGQQEPSEG